MKPNRGVATLTIALLLASCGGGGGSGDSSKTLTYWSMWTKPEPQAKVIQKAADAFEIFRSALVDEVRLTANNQHGSMRVILRPGAQPLDACESP